MRTTKLQISLCRPVWVVPGRKPWTQVFSWWGSIIMLSEQWSLWLFAYVISTLFTWAGSNACRFWREKKITIYMYDVKSHNTIYKAFGWSIKTIISTVNSCIKSALTNGTRWQNYKLSDTTLKESIKWKLSQYRLSNNFGNKWARAKKTYKNHVCPGKSQLSLHVQAVWSESLLSALWVIVKIQKLLNGSTKDWLDHV